MNSNYYDTISKLEESNISRDYILGWASGFLGNPKIEEQRITDGWEAGYQDGQAKHIDHSQDWPSKQRVDGR